MKKDKIIKIKEEVKIGNVVLEEGDKIRIMNERLSVTVEQRSKELARAVYNELPKDDDFDSGVDLYEFGAELVAAAIAGACDEYNIDSDKDGFYEGAREAAIL